MAEIINVPLIYVEEELDILVKGCGQGYGVLKRTANGKYCHNVLILSEKQKKQLTGIYEKNIDAICDIIYRYVSDNIEKYMSFPFLNREVSKNLVLWLHTHSLAYVFPDAVDTVLQEKYLKEFPGHNREFSLFGYISDGIDYGCGWNGSYANNVCGYEEVKFSNLSDAFIDSHFFYGRNIGQDKKLQMALKAVNGLDIGPLDKDAQEIAALAIQEGYLYRSGDKLYTKILGYKSEDAGQLFSLDYSMTPIFGELTEKTAGEIYAFIKKEIPEYLYKEARYVNNIAQLPIVDRVIECLIDKGLIEKPAGRLGAEGCFFEVK